MAKIQKLRDASNQSEADRQILICSSAEDFLQNIHFNSRKQDDSLGPHQPQPPTEAKHHQFSSKFQETASLCSLEQHHKQQLLVQKKSSKKQ